MRKDKILYPMKKIINLYCDESCHLKNNGEKVSMLGYIGVQEKDLYAHKKALKKINDDHEMHTEIKWNKVSKSKISYYGALLDYFTKSNMIFRGLIIPTGYSGLNYVNEEEYYKMYFKLLSHELNLNYTYNIYIDIKDTNSHKNVKKLHKKLDEDSLIKHQNVQTIRSEESIFLQLTDLVLGTFTYDLNVKKKVFEKQYLAEKLTSYFNTYDDYGNISEKNSDLVLIKLKNF